MACVFLQWGQRLGIKRFFIAIALALALMLFAVVTRRKRRRRRRRPTGYHGRAEMTTCE